ncbi:hypothetical protein AAON49_02855 [Pseudotenacibaculum sp. MALMAid0570]|uniref:hypothetical protein n=1 Tax=Pseudotenacibaculum sp. MALMAid0570 TaxID=3143938 RepID=UPI0032DEA4A2
MLNHNTKEYEIITASMEAIRHRLTTHLSFTIGGSGIFYFAMNILGKPNSNELAFPLICIFAATLISSFFYLALYKFNSMNRYAGYCKLINIEIGSNKIKKADTDKKIKQIITWEICMGKLANTKIEIEFPIGFWKKAKYNGIEMAILKNNFEKYKIHNPKIDYGARKKGLLMLLRGINKKDNSKTWKYPLYSSYVYYFLIFIFVSLSISGVISFFIQLSAPMTYMQYSELTLISVLLLTILFVLQKSLSEMYKLMIGSKTVSAYCWKFLPYRIQILNNFGIRPTYYITEKKEV